MPYRARINERMLLNLPGFHDAAYVYVYVEDTTERALHRNAGCAESCSCCPSNFEPRMVLEVADCYKTISLAFDIDSGAGRENSLHKLETLVSALRLFREALVAEFEPYDGRKRQLESARA